MRKNILTYTIIGITVILGLVGVFTAIKLYQLRNEGIALNAPQSKPAAADFQCQNGEQNRDQNMWLICECANGCTQKCDTSQGGGGCGWVCDQNCRLAPIGTQPQGSCTQVDYVHQGTSNYCGVANISCPASCQTTDGTPPPSNKLCDDTCNVDSDCASVSPAGASLQCNKTIHKCVNKICPNDTVPGDNCSCAHPIQTCGQPCGGAYPLCAPGFQCTYIVGPSCTRSTTAKPTTYCVPYPDSLYSYPKCVAQDTANSYFMRRSDNKSVWTAQDLAAVCNPPTLPPTTPPSTCKVQFSEKDHLYCAPNRGEVTVTGTAVDIPANSTLQTSWYIVSPNSVKTTQVYKSQPIKTGDTFTITGTWPGTNFNETVEIHFGINILDSNGNPVPNCSGGLDYFWGPVFKDQCSPTPTPTSLPNMCSLNFVLSGTATPTATPTDTPTSTPTSTPTDTPTSSPTTTPTSTATATASPTSTPTSTASPTSSPTSTASSTATPTSTPSIAIDTQTPTPTLPNAGNGMYTMFGAIAATALIILSIFLAL